jgi:hypothetical protein
MRYIKPRAVIECVAELILNQKHTCGPDCLCWQLRQVPAIDDAVRKLHLQKLQSKPEEGI